MKIDEVKKDLRCASSQLIDEINCQRQLLAAENNELQVKMSKQDSLEFMDSVYRTFRNHEIAADKNIEIDKSSEDFEFISDATLIFRIVGNILKNSLEASKARQTVTLGCRKNENDFSFWCHNDSVMPDDVKLQIFQRSYSTKGKGRGIGTYSIKLLTEKYLKGKVSFVSEAGAGTVFTVCFKCAP
jgi:sensor histidine kinase regulating citrate/malate metabolism